MLRNCTLIFSALFLLSGCPGSPPADAPPAKEEPKKDDKKKDDKKKDDKKKDDKKKDEAKKASPADRWKDYPGPHIEQDLAGKKAWMAIPISTKWDQLKMTTQKVDSSKKKYQVYKFVGKELYVPNAFTTKAKKSKDLAEKDPVIAAKYVTNVYGRVSKVNGDKIEVTYAWAGKIEKKEIDAIDVMKLEGKKSFGSPVAYKDGKKWKAAKMVYKGDDKSWVIGFASRAKQVPTKDVKAVDVKKYKKGDKVWAAFVGTFKPAEITGVIEKGVKYKVKFDTSETEVSFTDVTSPLE